MAGKRTRESWEYLILSDDEAAPTEIDEDDSVASNDDLNAQSSHGHGDVEEPAPLQVSVDDVVPVASVAASVAAAESVTEATEAASVSVSIPDGLPASIRPFFSWTNMAICYNNCGVVSTVGHKIFWDLCSPGGDVEGHIDCALNEMLSQRKYRDHCFKF